MTRNSTRHVGVVKIAASVGARWRERESRTPPVSRALTLRSLCRPASAARHSVSDQLWPIYIECYIYSDIRSPPPLQQQPPPPPPPPPPPSSATGRTFFNCHSRRLRSKCLALEPILVAAIFDFMERQVMVGRALLTVMAVAGSNLAPPHQMARQ